MADPAALADPLIQNELLAEALQSANVGFLVWDEDRRYIAANSAACDILGTTLEQLLGQPVGAQTRSADVEELIENAVRSNLVYGTAQVARYDSGDLVAVFYATFTTRSAGMPFMATVISRIDEAG